MTIVSDTKFVALRNALQDRFDTLVAEGHNIYQSALTKDQAWELYMTIDEDSPVFRERTHHDCQCCKRFIRNVGRVLFSLEGRLVSIWDSLDVPAEYDDMVNLLADTNRDAGIAGIYLNDEEVVGRKESYEQLPDGTVYTWEHFEVTLPSRAYSTLDDVATRKSTAQTSEKVLRRSVTEISETAVEQVIELCESDLILRSSQQLPVVKGLQQLQREAEEAPEPRTFFWDKTVEYIAKGFNCNIRGSSIGTLLVDLTEGVDLGVAVKKYEDKTNGANYMRSKPLFTQKQKDDAIAMAKEEGYEPSFYRRHAVKSDISVLDVLFADGTVAQQMADSPFDVLSPVQKAKKPNFDRVKEVGVEEFITKILPNSESVELFLENKHEANLVSLVTAVHPDAPTIMKWGNNTSWDFNGGYADSVIAERVAAKGGKVDAPIRVSMAWSHRDDLDLHMNNTYKQHVYFGDYCYGSISHDTLNLDVDMRGSEFHQVENMTILDPSELKRNSKMPISVHNYSENRSHPNDPERVEGFEIEVEIFGELHSVKVTDKLRNNGRVDIGELVVDGKGNVMFNPFMPSQSSVTPRKLWNVMSCDFVPVEMAMRSPNFWDSADKGGNEFVFFMLKDCKNPDPVQGFYNEYLSQEFRPHRKVFEMLGSMMKAPYSDEQLSGVGFSKSQRNDVVLRVTGETTRVFRVKF